MQENQGEKQLENLEPRKRTWGGPRINSGRPKGIPNPKTVVKRAVERDMKQRIMRSVNTLINAQKTLARGRSYLYRIETKGSGKDKKQVHVLVTDPEEIREYLDADSDTVNDHYYYITTKDPDNKAIDSMLDRAFGKARQNIGLDGGLDEDNKPIPLLAGVNVIALNVSSNNSTEEDREAIEANTSDTGGDFGGEDYINVTATDRQIPEDTLQAGADLSSIGDATTPEERGDEGLLGDNAAAQVLQPEPVEQVDTDLSL